MTFTDVDAYEDIYDECAVIGKVNKDNESVAMSIKQLHDNKWYEDRIKMHYKKFELDPMSNRYCNWYRTI